MDLSFWSFVFSAAGLLLGAVAAYPQLRSFAQRTLRLSLENTERWMAAFYGRVDFYIAYPSALIAYIARDVLFLSLLLLVGMLLFKPDGLARQLPPWSLLTLQLVFTFVIGKIGGDLLNIVRVVVQRAKKLHAQHGASG